MISKRVDVKRDRKRGAAGPRRDRREAVTGYPQASSWTGPPEHPKGDQKIPRADHRADGEGEIARARPVAGTQRALKVRPARSVRRLRNAGPISEPGVQVPPSPCTSRTRQRALSAIILLVEPYPGSRSPVTSASTRPPSGSSPRKRMS